YIHFNYTLYTSFLDIILLICFFFFTDTPTTDIYTLSLHDALPICPLAYPSRRVPRGARRGRGGRQAARFPRAGAAARGEHPRVRSEEHTSELQSRFDLVCRLLLEKKKTKNTIPL